MSFKEATDTILNSSAGQFDGIGFVFKEGGGLTGIDLDKCIDPDTGAIESWAEDIIRGMDSYTEFSVSGTGFHIIVKGTIPGKKNRKDKIEMYDSQRFFVVTGNVFGEPLEVMERQSDLNKLYTQVFPEPAKRDYANKPSVIKNGEDRLNALSDTVILEKLFREPQGAKWRMLYEQGWNEGLGYRSHSEADFAFASKLAFYSSDTEQIRCLFSASALGKRDKWESRADYQDRVITNAMDGQVEKYSKRSRQTQNEVGVEPDNHNSEGDEYPEIAPFEAYSIPTFPLDIFPKWLRDYVGGVANFVQTPVDAPAMMALSVLAVAVQRRFNVEIYPGYVEPLCLYTITALPSGARKSPVFKKMVEPIQTYEKQLRKEMASVIAKRKVHIENLKDQYANELKRIKTGTADTQSRLVEIQQSLDETKELFPPALIKQDITAEKLIQVLSENQNRIGILGPESNILDIASGLYADKKTNVDIYLKGFDCEYYAYDRKNGGSIYLDSPAISIGLMVQNDKLKGVLSNRSLHGQGLFARFLYAIPDSLAGKMTPRGASIPCEVETTYHSMVTLLLNRKPATHGGNKIDLTELVLNEVRGKLSEEDEPAQTLRFSQEAGEVYDRLSMKVQPYLRDDTHLTSDLRSWLSKLVGRVMRIGGLLHMAEHADQEELPEEVAASTVEAAVRLEEYLYAHTLKAFGQASEGVHAEKQKYILQALAIAQGNDTLIKWFTPTNIWNLLKRKGYAKVTYMDKDLQELVDRNYLLVQHMERHGNGRDSTMYGLNPKAIELLNR
ncbi:phage NrS-1 polymerase family protein [Paenibacillus sp. FSL H8-0034]|uniref:phage NrS-1 polymerase family protein n=1 Tax=Paenibacillus sp. FSL H8-0034 TaxID=2954671 RepID=UPI0030F4D91C